MRALTLLPILLVAFYGVGCTVTGIEPLGKLRDRATNCGKSSFMRTTDTGTEVFLFGVRDPALATPDPLPTDPETGERIPTCFARVFVEFDSTTVVEQGTYTLDASGKGVFDIVRRSTFEYDPATPILKRPGAKQDDNPMPPTYDLAIEADGDEVIIALDGEPRRITNFYDVIAMTDPTTLEGAEDIFRLLNIPLFTSQPRIAKFGSTGMVDYNDQTVEFQALVANYFTISMKGFTTVTIAYYDFEDMHGIEVTGDQITYADFKGNGTMAGILSFTMRGSDDELDVVRTGTLDYGAVKLGNGVAAGGVYPFTVDGHAYDISYELASNVDLRRLLPPSTP